jgi:single-strand DNA-binding protein
VADNDNTITVVGRIGQEPELRATPKGDVLNFSVATNERKRGADGEYTDGPTSWFRIAAWHDLGRHAHASLHRGQRVIVSGVLTIREFQVEGGGKSRNAELRATALGHDLRWGTSAFADAPRQQQQQTPPTVPAAAAPESVPQLETVPPTPPADWGTGFTDEAPF